MCLGGTHRVLRRFVSSTLSSRFCAMASAPRVTPALLSRQDAYTSEAVIAQLFGNASFAELAAAEALWTANRDREDDAKLQAGVDEAVAKGVLPAGLEPAPYHKIAVEGKDTDMITGEIIERLPKDRGSVIVLVGASGTGKGTTVARLAQQLPRSITWSNGNVFRALTVLAVRWCEAQGLAEFDEKCALTPENIASFMGKINFGPHGDGFDIVIEGVGRVSEIANTTLKEPYVGKNIPTVSNKTQGEVVTFVARATKMMSDAGMNVIIEGRAATVNHIPTPFRFELSLNDPTTIGRRRAAQRIMALAAKDLAGRADATADEIDASLRGHAAALAPKTTATMSPLSRGGPSAMGYPLPPA
jgi:cytidylate kinase